SAFAMLLTMRKFLLPLVFFFLLASPIHQAAFGSSDSDKSKNSKSGKVKLVLTAYPRQGFMPMHISFNVELQGVSEDDAEYYCLHEEWDFGDGAVSAEQPNCEEFTKGKTKATTHFFAEHIYEDEGNYTIRFTLGDPVKIRSNQIGVVVLERELGR